MIKDFTAQKRPCGTVEYAAIDIRIAQISAVDFSPFKTGFSQIGPSKVNASQICIAKIGFPSVSARLNHWISSNAVELCITEVAVACLLNVLEPVVVHEASGRLQIAEIRDFQALEDTTNSAK
ncbi:hypothetical protein BI292_10455 [Pseudomonas sp. 43NM1]|nr:hypothetical protein BI292_10455 [Pseudomonas sp. 43NM1]